MTVTAVETSRDLRTAKVFVSVLGTDEEREATSRGIALLHGVIQIAGSRRLETADEVHPDR